MNAHRMTANVTSVQYKSLQWAPSCIGLSSVASVLCVFRLEGMCNIPSSLPPIHLFFYLLYLPSLLFFPYLPSILQSLISFCLAFFLIPFSFFLSFPSFLLTFPSFLLPSFPPFALFSNYLLLSFFVLYSLTFLFSYFYCCFLQLLVWASLTSTPNMFQLLCIRSAGNVHTNNP